jgi:hypothetical protein
MVIGHSHITGAAQDTAGPRVQVALALFRTKCRLNGRWQFKSQA